MHSWTSYNFTDARAHTQRHDTAGAALALWLKDQSQDVWAHVILANRHHGEHGFELYWIIDQPALDQANVIRLFWTLFDERAYMNDPGFVMDEEHNGPMILTALKELLSRFETGFYPQSNLELTKDEAFFYSTIVIERTRRALRTGWDEKDAAFVIPRAFTRPIAGAPLSCAPILSDRSEYPAPTDALSTITANSAAERSRRAARTRRLRSKWLISNAALFVGIPVLLLWGWYLFFT